MIWDTIEDMDNTRVILATDKSITPRTLQFTILQTPTHGILLDPVNQLQLHPGDSLMTTNRAVGSLAGVPVIYRPDANYFNMPNQTWSGTPLDDTVNLDEFSYVIADTAVPTYRSIPANVKIRVLNVNDGSTPVCPMGPFTVNATDTKVSADDDGLPSYDRVYINGFQMVDLDRQVDVVRVNITAQHGMLTLNKQHRGEVDFTSNVCYTSTSWYCVGSGVNDMSMVFIGTPSSVTAALNVLRYQSYESNYTDSITLTVYDGADAQQGDGDQCISATYQSTSSIRTSCMIASCAVSVLVRPQARDLPPVAAQGYWNGYVSTQLWAILGVAGVLMLSLFSRWLYVGYRAACAQKYAGDVFKNSHCSATPVCHISVRTGNYSDDLTPVDNTLTVVQRKGSGASIGVSSAHDTEM
jgi:hypothetical protein